MKRYYNFLSNCQRVTVSYLESFSAHSHLTLFLTSHDLFGICCCSHSLHKKFRSAYVMSVKWTAGNLVGINELERKHVRTVIVKTIQGLSGVPSQVTHLEVCLKFGDPNGKICPGVLPSRLRTLSLEGNFDHYFAGQSMLPQSLTELSLNHSFNAPFDICVLPSQLLKLQLGAAFNQRLAALPPKLTELIFGYNYNQPLSASVLPSNLSKLVFGDSFNHPLKKGTLPDSITWLGFGDMFNQPIQEGVLPARLTKLAFGFNYCASLPVLPCQLQSLKCGHEYNEPLEPGMFPVSLTSLVFGYFCNQLTSEVLPSRLRSLYISGGFNSSLSTLPTSLTYLNLGGSFNRWIENDILPTGLRCLIFGRAFNQPLLPGVFPRGLTTLVFGSSFNQPLIQNVLPLNLIELSFGEAFCQDLSLNGILPDKLETITFAKGGNYSIPDRFVWDGERFSGLSKVCG